MRPRWWTTGRHENTAWAIAEQLDALAREVRSGSTLRHALDSAAETHLTFGLGSGSDGGSPDDAIARQAIDLAFRLDGHEAACLHHAASLLRERAALADEASAHAAAAWASARMLTVLPGLVVTWSVLTSASFREALTSPAGRVCAGAGALANALGWRWMQHVVASVAP